MRRDRRERHPLADSLVFALAVLLAVVMGYLGVRRLASVARREGGGPPPPPPRAPERHGLESSGTGAGVPMVPPLRIARTGTLTPRTSAVPPPSKKD